MNAPKKIARQTPLDLAVALAVLGAGVAVSLFSLRNNDIWWMMGTGRYLLETRSFIRTDPFSFALAGHPWCPQSYLSAIIFYLVYHAAGAVGLITLRVVMVAAVLAVSLRTLARSGVSWAMSGIVVVLVLLIAHTRFIVRAHLFEYVFIAVMMGFLLSSHERKGRSFFVLPAIVQVLWTNMHPSFLLGPALVVMFFAGEYAAERMPGFSPLHRRDWRRVGILIGIVLAACLVNPSPAAFLAQPFGGQQRELISRFTLEWKSPFDPAVARADFHPYYEILLGVAALAVLASWRRLPLSVLFLLVSTAFLSTRSHRFRVEFALVALPLVCVLVRDGPVAGWVSSRAGPRKSWARAVLAASALALIAVTVPARVEVGTTVADRYPDRAFAFVADNAVARRAFSTIGFGSYMVWDLYGERKTFIDGRNYDAGLYRDFLVAQTNRNGLDHVIEKYRLDAFIIPAVEASDAGMTNIHRELLRMQGWSLVYLDEVACVYVRDQTVDSTWLDGHRYRAYHPLTFSAQPPAQSAPGAVAIELERACAEAPNYTTLWTDLGIALSAAGEHTRAVEALKEAARLDPADAAAWNRLGYAAMAGGDFETAIGAFERLAAAVPGDARPYMSLAEALAAMGRTAEALERAERAVALDPTNKNALELRGRIRSALGR